MPDPETVRLTIRHFFLGYDVALRRTWEFHDHLAARPDVTYHLHIIGHYPDSSTDLDDRPYVTREWPLSKPFRSEVWIIRGWNHPRLVLAALLARYRRIPILMWAERPGSTYEATNFKEAIRIRLRRILLPILFVPYRKGTTVLGTDQRAVKAFRKLSGGSPGRVFPYPNPIADACLRSARHRVQKEVPLLLFLGSFTRRKAVDLVADACKVLWRSGLEFRMRYVGEGPLGSVLKEHASRSGGRMEIYPFASRAALVEHLGEADTILLPSRFDGWGLPVHEGLASGVPAIVSDACGAAELVVQSECGRVVPAGDAEALVEAMRWVVRLAPEEREDLREKALEIANRLTIPKLADLLLSYCSKALKPGSGNS